MVLTSKEVKLLREIEDSRRFPIVRFELKSSKEDDLISTALNHVRITDAEDSMEKVKALSAILLSLDEQALVDINYNVFLTARSDYQVYYDSKLYKMLCQMAEEAKARPEYLFDIPSIKKGVVTLTKKGEKVLKHI